VIVSLLRVASSVAIIALAVVWTVFVLAAESQWQVLAALVIAAVAVFAFSRMRAGSDLAATLNDSGPGIVAVLPLAVLVVPIAVHQDHFQLMVLASVRIYGLGRVGLTVQFGYAGVINFAGAAFFGIGGYTAAVLGSTGVPSLLILLAGGFVAAMIGCIIILPVLRTKGHYAALITIAF